MGASGAAPLGGAGSGATLALGPAHDAMRHDAHLSSLPLLLTTPFPCSPPATGPPLAAMTLAQPHHWICAAGAAESQVVCGRWAPAMARDQGAPDQLLMGAAALAAAAAAHRAACADCAPARRAVLLAARAAARAGARCAAPPAPAAPRRTPPPPGVVAAGLALQPDAVSAGRLPAQWHRFHAKCAAGPRKSRLSRASHAAAPSPPPASLKAAAAFKKSSAFGCEPGAAAGYLLARVRA
jgi:hypothetical protein